MSARYRRLTKHPVADLGDELTVLQLDSETFYSMSGVARFVWDALELGATSAELQTALLAIYDVDPEICGRDVRSFLAELEAAGLVAVERASVEPDSVPGSVA